MFGFSFGELVVLVIVAIVVIGPKDLPRVLRKVGQWAGKLRRMAADLRAQSGIDDVLRSEGLSDDIAEIRKLARGELDNVVRSARVDLRANDPYAYGAAGAAAVARGMGSAHDGGHGEAGFPIDRDREYPREGADGYRALPDTAIIYAEHFPPSPHAKDALYMLGDANAVMPQASSELTSNAPAGAEPAGGEPSDAEKKPSPRDALGETADVARDAAGAPVSIAPPPPPAPSPSPSDSGHA